MGELAKLKVPRYLPNLTARVTQTIIFGPGRVWGNF